MAKKTTKPDEPVVKLKNLGPKTAEKLNLVGIKTIDDLHNVGAIEAYVRLKHLNPTFISLLGLYAMQAGLMGIHWLDLPEEIKSDLKEKIKQKLP